MQTCPECGAKQCKPSDHTAKYTWLCGSSLLFNGILYRSRDCMIDRIASLTAEVERLQTLIDSLPAADADWRWETLRKWLPVVADDWDRAGMPQKKFAVAYIIDKMDQIDAVISAPSPPAAEGAERPPALIRAKPRKSAGYAWLWRAGTMWIPIQGTYNRVSRELFDVDRASSTPAALALYDNDISNSGPAAQQTGEG